MQNPISFPQFSSIIPTEIEPTLKKILNENRQSLNALLKQSGPFTWKNLISPLEDMQDRLSQFWSPISHMHSVVETEELRAVYNVCLPLLTEYNTEFLQNEKLYQAVQSIADTEYSQLDVAQRKIIDNELRDFKLAGVHLSPEKKMIFAELQKQLSKASTEFAENLLDATQAWTLSITDAELVKGLPEQALKTAEETATQQQKTGWVFTLDYPSYSAVMKYATHRDLRRQMYEAYITRASDQGPFAGRFDNSVLMDLILKTRHELANLLHFPHYADYSLATKMAKTPEQVLGFLRDLVQRAKSFAERDMRELKQFAKSRDNIEKFEPWDLGYYTEKLRKEKYDLSQEELRHYFPINKVLTGMFEVIHRLYGMKIKEITGVDTWHPHVQFFEIRDEKNELRGYFYIDLYARPHKRDGAWMDECRIRRQLSDGAIQLPIAFLTCNFNRPVGDNPALLTHDDVITLFHEFGHCLHHLLTQINYMGASGINGVAWDAVEFPSQFLENWCWEKETLSLISAHHETGQSLPDALYQKMMNARNFHAGMHMLRQLEFALFDFRIHLEYDPLQESRIQTILTDVRKHVAVVPISTFNRFQHSFSHIFSGAYGAGYYSYEWADVLASDAFSLFEEKGIFDYATGRSFLKNILEQGGSREPMELFTAFRGREPQIDALLRQRGLSSQFS